MATLPTYEKNDPRGWCGDMRRGAALGRSTITGPRNFAGKFVLREVTLDSGGYDRLGTYFGHSPVEGSRLYWYAAVGEVEIEGVFRALTRKAAKDVVLGLYPKARFFR